MNKAQQALDKIDGLEDQSATAIAKATREYGAHNTASAAAALAAQGGGSQPGAVVMRGPFTVDFHDLADDGDSLTIYEPEAGEVLVNWCAVISESTNWNTGNADSFIALGQNVVLDDPGPAHYWGYVLCDDVEDNNDLAMAYSTWASYPWGSQVQSLVYPFDYETGPAPVEVKLQNLGSTATGGSMQVCLFTVKAS